MCHPEGQCYHDDELLWHRRIVCHHRPAARRGDDADQLRQHGSHLRCPAYRRPRDSYRWRQVRSNQAGRFGTRLHGDGRESLHDQCRRYLQAYHLQQLTQSGSRGRQGCHLGNVVRHQFVWCLYRWPVYERAHRLHRRCHLSYSSRFGRTGRNGYRGCSVHHQHNRRLADGSSQCGGRQHPSGTPLQGDG